jgi:hypothetical protein
VRRFSWLLMSNSQLPSRCSSLTVSMQLGARGPTVRRHLNLCCSLGALALRTIEIGWHTDRLPWNGRVGLTTTTDPNATASLVAAFPVSRSATTSGFRKRSPESSQSAARSQNDPCAIDQYPSGSVPS